MNLSFVVSQVLGQINWIVFAFAVVVAFGIGAVWYSLLFYKMWIRVFRLDASAGMGDAAGMVRSFTVQCITGAMLGFLFFFLTAISVKMAVFGVLTVAGWQMCAITFKYGKWKEFGQAILIESGYTLVCGIIYILFALI